MTVTPLSSSPLTALPAPGHDLSCEVNGRTIRLSATAGNRWQIAETIGALVIGHGELVAVNGTYAISTSSGISLPGITWPTVLGHHLDTAA